MSDIDAKQLLEDNGYEEIMYLTNYSYDSALIGVSDDNRAVYDYDKMVAWLVDNHGFTQMDAVDYIDYNTIRAIDYTDGDTPIIMYPLIRFDEEDPVQVVRCKDCCKYEHNTCTHFGIRISRKPDDYCSSGKECPDG